jgi:riboflavin synthase
MFTGIIQEVGKVHEVVAESGASRITVRAPGIAKELKVDDSVAVNGVCQTVVVSTPDAFTVVAVEETLRKTTFNELSRGMPVNLELPLRLGDRLGGHLVSGHVDCAGRVATKRTLGGSWLFGIEIPHAFERFVIPVGSIAIDGVSLTVASIDGTVVTVSIIPHTMENTLFASYTVGTNVNLEFDMIGKFIERLVSARSQGEGGTPLTPEQLLQWGYRG